MLSIKKKSNIVFGYSANRLIKIGDDIEIELFKKNMKRKIAIRAPQELGIVFTTITREGTLTYAKTFKPKDKI